MSGPEIDAVRRENAYLKTRCAQLQNDVTDLAAQLARATEILDRVHARRVAEPPNPLGSGQ